MSDDTRELATLLSDFVQERVDKPAKGEIDLWFEGVCAALFAVAFTAVPVIGRQPTEEAFDEELVSLIDDLTAVASHWVEDRMSRSGRWFMRVRIKFSVGDHLKQRLVMYFNEGTTAMGERGYSLADATSHAIVAVGTQAMLALAYKDRALRKVDLKETLRLILEGCESMAGEISAAIYQRSAN